MVRLLHKVHEHKQFFCCPFNPTMVRLLLGFIISIVEAINDFQSHNGAIAALSPYFSQ